jgi:hypothetical protein
MRRLSGLWTLINRPTCEEDSRRCEASIGRGPGLAFRMTLKGFVEKRIVGMRTPPAESAPVKGSVCVAQGICS